MAIWLSCAQNLKLPYLYVVLVLLHSSALAGCLFKNYISENAKFKKLLNIFLNKMIWYELENFNKKFPTNQSKGMYLRFLKIIFNIQQVLDQDE